MKGWLSIIVCSLLVDGLYAQVSDYRTDKLEGLRLTSGDMIMGKSLDGPDIVGTKFLYDEWIPGELLTFGGGHYEHINLKYDVENNVLAAIEPRTVKEYYLTNSKIREFTLKGRRFVNKASLTENYSKDDGFVEVLFQGNQISLAKFHFTHTLKPTYKEGLDMGTRDFRIVKKEELQILVQNRFVKVPGKKSDFLALFGKNANAVEQYLKTEKLNIKNEWHLVRVAGFYDGLIE